MTEPQLNHIASTGPEPIVPTEAVRGRAIVAESTVVPKAEGFRQRYKLELTIVIAGLVAMNLIFFAGAFRGSAVDATTAGQLGDFVGGYVGTFFALVSVVLLYATLKHQQRGAARQSFEGRYFELIRLHRENVAELKLGAASGRKIFVMLLREWRLIHQRVRRVARMHGLNLTQTQQAHIAYYCLFFGTGPNSSRMLRRSLIEYDERFVFDLDRLLSMQATKLRAKKERRLSHVPFEGHQSRLGHYYRHLYQTIRYVAEYPLDIERYEYAKTVRAQLSTHEQSLLLLNSLCPIGSEWWSRNLIQDYRLVQNIPREFFDPHRELDLSLLFRPGYFEWEEIDNKPTLEGTNQIMR